MTTVRDYHNDAHNSPTDSDMIAALKSQRDRVVAAHREYLAEKDRLAALIDLAAPARKQAA